MLNEAETRTQLIDPRLKDTGWGTVDGSRVREEYVIAPGRITGIGQKPKSLIADYLLVYRNTHLAVVETKADTKHHTEGLAQAKDYAAKMRARVA